MSLLSYTTLSQLTWS